jgi:tetratricopeptide (TPR) repeat protein
LPKDRRVTLWVRTLEEATPHWQAGQGAVITAGEWVDGGRRYEVVVGKDAQEILMEVGNATAQAVTRLRVSSDAEHPALEAARQARAEGRLDDAIAQLEAISVGASPKDKAHFQSLLARIHIQAGRTDQAIDLLSVIWLEHRAQGNVSQAVVDAMALAFQLVRNGSRFTEARAALAVKDETAGHSVTAFTLNYMKAQLSLEVGDLRAAMEMNESCWHHVERTGFAEALTSGQAQRGFVLLAMGRQQEAYDAFSTVLKRDSAMPLGLPLAQALNNIGWASLLCQEAGEPCSTSRESLFVRARELYDSFTSEGDQRRVNVRINLALEALHAGDWKRAKDYLEEAKAQDTRHNAGLGLWILDVECRVLAARKQYAPALAGYRRMQTLAERLAAPDAVIRAVNGQASMLASIGRNEEALAQYERGRALFGASLLRVGLTDGRAAFAAQNDLTLRRHLSLLLRLKQDGEAMSLVRRSRIQLIESLIADEQTKTATPQARAAWDAAAQAYRNFREKVARETSEDWGRSKIELSARTAARSAEDQRLTRELDAAAAQLAVGQSASIALRPPEETEVLLAFARKSDGWVGLATDSSSTLAAAEPALSGVELTTPLAERLLVQLEGKIRGKQLVRILGGDDLGDIGLHTLVLWGKPLIESVAVVYGLDLPVLTTSAPRSPRALVVTDPEGNLPAARAELSIVLTRLSTLEGPSPVSLSGQAASLEAVVRALDGATFWHFSGHAQPDPFNGWGSTLRLANQTSLGPADVLALRQPPQTAVLLGCGTGRARGASASVLGVAQALLVAGASTVIAASRDLRDETAADFTSAFYAELTAGRSVDSAAQAAVLALRQRDMDWGALRVYKR